MKRFTLVALVAALLFGVATMASATELKVRGHLDVYGMWSANLGDFDSDKGDGDNYMTSQRMRTWFEFVANENLKAVLGLEIDNIWGQPDGPLGGLGLGRGAGWGTDAKGNIKVKHAYLDFTLPDTAINVKAGLQYVALPSIFGHPVFEDDAAALVVSAPINDMFGLALGYTRGYDAITNVNNSYGTYAKVIGSVQGLLDPGSPNIWGEVSDRFLKKDNVDMAFLAAPVTLDGFDIAPYFAYARVGKDAITVNAVGNKLGAGALLQQSLTSEAIGSMLNKGWMLRDAMNIWILGAHAELTMFDPLTFAADLIYGEGRGKVARFHDGTLFSGGGTGALDSDFLNGDSEKATYKTRGWYAALAASYKFDFMTGTLFGTYGTGARNSATKDAYLPTLAEGWGLTPYIGGVRAFGTAWDSFGPTAHDGTGLWSVGLSLEDITFVDNLSHKLVFAFAKGTSSRGASDFDKKDQAWEVYMVNKYQIYENLAAINELGYFNPNLKRVSGEDPSYFGTIGFKYTF